MKYSEGEPLDDAVKPVW